MGGGSISQRQKKLGLISRATGGHCPAPVDAGPARAGRRLRIALFFYCIAAAASTIPGGHETLAAAAPRRHQVPDGQRRRGPGRPITPLLRLEERSRE